MGQGAISTAAAKQDKLFYVVANIIIVDAHNKTILLIKRSETEKVFPGKWAFPGGKLEHGDVSSLIIAAGTDPVEGVDNILGKLAAREAKEECGLAVREETKVLSNKVFVRPDGIPVFMAVLVSEYIGGDVVLEAGAVSDYSWVTAESVRLLDCIPGVAEQVAAVLR